MKTGNKVSLGLALLIAASVGYCSLPLTSYAILIVAVTDQNARPIQADVSAMFLDRTGAPIVTITPQTVGSWGSNLQWYTHSSNSNSLKRPEDAQQAQSRPYSCSAVSQRAPATTAGARVGHPGANRGNIM